MRSLRIFLVGVATVTVLLFGTGAAFAEEPPLFTEPGWNTPTPSLPVSQIPGLDCTLAGTCQINPANLPDLGVGTPSGAPGTDVGTGTGSPVVTPDTPVAATDATAVDADTSSTGHTADKASRSEDSTSSSGGGSGAGLLVAAGLAAVAAGGGVVFMRRRRSHKASFAA